MKIKCSTVAYWLVALAIVVSENYFYLIDSNMHIAGVNVLDWGFGLVAGLAVLLEIILRDFKHINYRFGSIFLFAIVMVFTSALQSEILYGQSMWLGLRPQRTFLLWVLLYFPIRKCLSLEYLSYDGLEKLIYKLGIVELVLYITQFIVGSHLTFLHVLHNNVYSTTRYYFNTIFLCLLLFICLDKIFRKEKIIFNLCFVVAALFEVLYVGKMRLTFIAVVSAILCGLFLWRKGGSIKILICLCGIAAIGILSSNEVISSIIPALNDTAKVDTLSIRESGRAYYLSVLAKHPILGGGYISTEWPASVVGSGLSQGYGWVDNGIFGFAFFNGLLGVAWIVILLIKLYKNAYILLKSNRVYLFFVMPIYWIVSCINEAHWYFSSFLPLTILICMLESHLDKFK